MESYILFCVSTAVAMSKLKPASETCQEALIGSSTALKKQYNKAYNLRQRQFHTSQFFRSVRVISEADWLANHNETGQTFESFWRENVAVGHRALTERPLRPQTALGFRPKQSEKLEATSKLICLQPIGRFPSAELVGKHHPFIVWLQSYSSTFFQTAEVRILPEVTVEEIKCDYRVNELTGRFQLNANHIIAYFKKNKPKRCRCLIGVTMTDLYPKSSWDFVFGLASTSSGVGVFSFARFQDEFYERWTLGEDNVCRNSDGTLDYSPFKKEESDGSSSGGEEIKGILLLRACKVMSHEVCHMLGMRHCLYYECLMNGSNHLQESDRRPPFLCPICMRKLQSVFQFEVLDRYKKMLAWTENQFWDSYLYREKQEEMNHQPTSLWNRRASLPEVTRPLSSLPKTTVRLQSTTKKNGVSSMPRTSRPTNKRPSTARNFAVRPMSSKPISSAPSTGTKLLHEQTALDANNDLKSKLGLKSIKESRTSKTSKSKGFSVPIPPLDAFNDYKHWLKEGINFLES